MTFHELFFGAAIRCLRLVVPTSRGMWRLSRLAVQKRTDLSQLRRRKTVEGFEMDLRLSCYPDIMMYYGVYEIPTMRTIQSLLRKGDVAVDVGANVGYITLNMAKWVGPEGKVLAFEPVPPTYERLQTNIEYNACTQVQSFPNAVGDTANGIVDVFLPKEGENAHSLSSLRKFADSDVFKVPAIRIDDVITEPVRLIKVDVEGAEVAVLQGAVKTIKQSRPFIVFEYNQEALARFDRRLQDLFGVIQSTGIPYEAFDIDRKLARIDMTVADVENAANQSTNILLRPKL